VTGSVERERYLLFVALPERIDRRAETMICWAFPDQAAIADALFCR
jgi:hypothetical protein